MTSYQQQLFGDKTFLEFTLDSQATVDKKRLLLPNNVSVEVWDKGVLFFHAEDGASADAILLSVGVHGNETAPIEIIDDLIRDILSGKISLAHNLLVVIANPEAINARSREVDENMNRLFINGAHHKHGDSVERHRSILLMNYSRNFFSRHAKQKFHYDLHATIRDSAFAKFAISPNLASSSIVEAQGNLLGLWGIEAILTTDKNSATYSSFTAQHCGAVSFTLELGRARPFGENDLKKMSSVAVGLRKMISGNLQAPPQAEAPIPFRVVTEVIKLSKEFRLCFPSSTANFTEFAVGDLLAVDNDYQYRVTNDGERILFPNDAAAVGQRALVIIRPKKLAKTRWHD